ncbi:hypothetical protein ARZXY2_4581 (plasmid) [Arthrobacter sp. ZXY-2]|nr:hypothetical protein ARZXY2_4581 [Arthrobacter sp. ZXY-2]
MKFPISQWVLVGCSPHLFGQMRGTKHGSLQLTVLVGLF